MNLTLEEREIVRDAADILDFNKKCEGQYFDTSMDTTYDMFDNILSSQLIIDSFCLEGAIAQALFNKRYKINQITNITKDPNSSYPIQIQQETTHITNQFFPIFVQCPTVWSDVNSKETVVDFLRAVAENDLDKVNSIVKESVRYGLPTNSGLLK